MQRGLEPLLQVVDSEVVVAIEANQIVLIALVVAHKNVFAMHASVVVPPTLRLADGFSLGVVVACITDVMLLQIVLYLLLAIHSSVYGFIRLCVYGFMGLLRIVSEFCQCRFDSPHRLRDVLLACGIRQADAIVLSESRSAHARNMRFVEQIFHYIVGVVKQMSVRRLLAEIV